MHKQITRRLGALFLALCLAWTLLPAPAAQAEEAGNVITVTSDEDLMAKVADTNIAPDTIIDLGGEKRTVTDLTNTDRPWILNQKITIQNGSLELRAAGILLGNDVTFKNVTFSFPHNICPAIMANGHQLTLEDVTRNTSTGKGVAYIFCGGFISESSAGLPAPTSFARINLEGSTQFDAIYAGNFALGTGEHPAEANAFTGSVEINLNTTANQQPVDGIYIYGLEQRTYPNTTTPSTFHPSPDTFTVSGNMIQVNLNQHAPGLVDATGNDKTSVYFEGDGALVGHTQLVNISNLSIGPGNFKPAAESSFASENTTVAVHNGTLGLQNMGNITIGDFMGGSDENGGSLVLAPEQTLTINGTVSGTTTVGIGQIFNGVTDPLTPGFTYISAPNSTETSFRLAKPSSTQSNMTLQKDSEGNWTAVGAGDTRVIVKSISMSDVTVQLSSSGQDIDASIPLDVKYVDNGALQSISFIPIISIGDEELTYYIDQDKNTEYFRPASGLYTVAVASSYDGDSECLDFHGKDDSGPPPAGVYPVTLTIPAYYTENGQDLTASATLTVLAEAGQETPVAVPEGKTLTYTGLELTGVEENPGCYDLTGHKATNVGTYTATATLKNGFKWADDGSTGTKSIAWEIVEAPAATVSSIRVSSTGHKTLYQKGDALDLTGLEITAAMSDGSTKTVAVTEAMVSGFNPSTVGNQTITITYEGQTCAYTVTVQEPGGPALYQVTVSGSHAQTSGAGNYEAGASVTVDAGSREGYRFTGWEAAGVTLTDPSQASVTFTMPAQAVSLTAKWEQTGGETPTLYEVRIAPSNGGALTATPASAAQDAFVTLHATPFTGFRLESLQVTGSQGAVSLQSQGGGAYVFRMPASHVDARAVFSRIPVSVTPPSSSGSGSSSSSSSGRRPGSSSSFAPKWPGSSLNKTGNKNQTTTAAPAPALPAIQPAGKPTTAVYRDIPANHWASGEISWAKEKGFLQGTGGETFAPQNPVSHQQLWMVAARLFGKSPESMAAASAWASQEGIAQGEIPGSGASRQGVVTMLYRCAALMGKASGTQGKELASFPDSASVDPAAQNAMAWAVANGILNGTSDGRLNPQGGVTRAQFAALLYRFCQRAGL